MRLRKLAMVAAMLLTFAGLAAAQEWRWQGHEGSNAEERSEAYHDGFRDGQRDRVHNRDYRPHPDHRWEDRDFRGAYENGYRAGFREGVAGGPAPGYGYAPAGVSGGNGQPGRLGYQDGVIDGRNDRMTGHSFRPTHDDNYNRADRGYSSAWGNKEGYKAEYRQGYAQGYQAGYNGR